MSEVTHQDIKNTPGQIVFLTYINILLKEKKATLLKDTNNIYLLNSESSNSFITGRDQSLNPFIGIQENMLPWFPEMNWSEVAVSYKKGYAYFIAREDESNNILFVLGLKVRRKRLISLVDPKNKNIGQNLNIKVFTT